MGDGLGPHLIGEVAHLPYFAVPGLQGFHLGLYLFVLEELLIHEGGQHGGGMFLNPGQVLVLVGGQHFPGHFRRVLRVGGRREQER